MALTRAALHVRVADEARQALAEHGARRQAVHHAALGVDSARLDGQTRVHAAVVHAGVPRRALCVRGALVTRLVRHCGTWQTEGVTDNRQTLHQFITVIRWCGVYNQLYARFGKQRKNNFH